MLYDSRKKIELIGVPSDLGANLRGANIAPACLRIAEVKKKIAALGYEVDDFGDIAVPIRDSLPQEAERAHYIEQIVDVGKLTASTVQHTLADGRIAVLLGGDHSIAIGSVAGSSAYFAEQGKKVGLVWIDAHADLNTTHSSPTGNIHGMPLATLLGQGDERLRLGEAIAASNVVLIGIRVLDPHEQEVCKLCGIKYYTMREIDERGLANVMKEAIATVTAETEALHVSFDLDALDPLHAPGVSTPVMGGLSYREAHLAFEMLYDSGKVCAFEVVELNPMRDVSHKSTTLAVELIQSLLGKTIL